MTRAIALSIATGALLAICFPPLDWQGLGWIAVSPLLLAATRRGPVSSAVLGLAAGLTCGLLQGRLSVPFAMLGVLLGAVASAASLARLRMDGVRWVAFVSASAVALEWGTTALPVPIHLALTQSLCLPVIQVASIAGIWGVSFLLWWANAAIVEVGLSRRRALPLAAATSAMIGPTLLFGFAALRAPRRDPGPSLIVAAIQDHPVDEPSVEFPDAPRSPESPTREALTRRAVAAGARLVVWPELTLGASFDPDSPADPTLALARDHGVPLVVGYKEQVGPDRFNASALIGPEGHVLGVHRKNHPWIDEEGVTPGREATAFDSPSGRIGVEICFDTCFTAITRREVLDGARLIASPTFDPPSPGGVLHCLHCATLPFRAVENRVPFVRADRHGLSQIVSPTGLVVASSPLLAPDALVAAVPLGDGLGTPFTRLGDWFAHACLAAAIGLAIVRISAKRATPLNPGESIREPVGMGPGGPGPIKN